MTEKVKLITRSVICVSAVVLCLMISPGALFSLACSTILGLFLAAFVFKNYREFSCSSVLELIVSNIIAILLCWAAGNAFYQTWLPSSIVKSISDYLSVAPATLVNLLRFILSILSFPAVLFYVRYFIYMVCSILRRLDFACLGRQLKELFSGKSLLQRALSIGTLVVLVSILGTILLLLAYSLPDRNIEKNMRTSATVFQTEGTYPNVFFWCHSKLDNYTDALILLEAADKTDDSLINRALLNYYGDFSKTGEESSITPDSIIVEHYINGLDFSDTKSYSRYWHGYLLYVKSLLGICDYATIRKINACCQLIAVLIIIWLMAQRKHREIIIPFILSYLMLMPVVLAMSLQNSSCFYVMTVGSIILLSIDSAKLRQRASCVFLLIGAATAYFDFLTYPIATFGVPAVLFLFLSSENKTEERCIDLLKLGIYWCCGYGGMWAMKWIIATILTDNNIIENALQAVSTRTSHFSVDGSYHISIARCLDVNIKSFFKTPFTVLVIGFIVIVLRKIIKDGYLMAEDICYRMFPYFLVSFAPFVWYLFALNHSNTHPSFTNRALVVTVFSLMTGLMEIKRMAGESLRG